MKILCFKSLVVLVLSILKYNRRKTNNKFVRLLFNNFYRVIVDRRVQKESDKLLYTARSLVMVRKFDQIHEMQRMLQRILFVSSLKCLIDETDRSYVEEGEID